jgi:hypothetical protein
MPSNDAERYARTMVKAWQNLADQIALLEQCYRGQKTEAATYIAGELAETRLPLIRTEADSETYAAAYALGRADERGETEEAAKVTPLHIVAATA